MKIPYKHRGFIAVLFGDYLLVSSIVYNYMIIWNKIR